MPDEEIFPVQPEMSPRAQGLIRGLLEEFLELDAAMDRAQECADGLRQERDAKEQELVGGMATLKVKTQKFDDGMSVTRVTRHNPSVPQANREDFHRWLKDNDYWGLARVPAQREKALLRELLDDEDKARLVPGYVRDFKQEVISVKGKVKK